MYRDFSDRSKNQLLGLVSQVESEKKSNFTDWIGDRWYDFEVIIGKLNIRRYLNDINTYHKKVIDKNNATQASINTIFKNVQAADETYKKTLSQRKSLLQQWQKYIVELSQIVNPGNGQFKADFISYTMDQRLNAISKTSIIDKEPKSKEELTKKAIKGESTFLKGLSKLIKKKDSAKSNDLELTSSAMSYIAGLYTFYTADYNDTSDIISGGLKLTKSSASMWNDVYKYLEGTLKPLDASRLGKKYQSKVGIVFLIGNLCGFTSDSIGTFKTLVNEDSEGYEKVKELLKTTSSGADVAKSVVNLKYGQKVLTRTVTAKYQWDTAAKNVSKVDKANTIVAVVGVVADTGVGMADRYGKVSADGVVDMGDFGEIGVAGSVRGLTSVVSGLTFGVSDALGLSDKADEITDNMLEFVDTKGVDFVKSHSYSSEYVQNAQFLSDYANNEENNIALRIGASAVAGTGMIGAVVIDGVADGCSWIGNKISDGWHAVRNWF